jgi:hypothetical protein
MKLLENILLATEFGQSHADVMRTALARSNVSVRDSVGSCDSGDS